MTKVMGYKGQLFYGVKGSTATTQITARKDVNYNTDVAVGATTAAGDGSSVPIVTGEATAITPNLDFSLVVTDDSTAIVALMAASKTGNPIAIRWIPADGMDGFDGDVVLSDQQGSPLEGEATLQFTVVAVSDELRDPVLNG